MVLVLIFKDIHRNFHCVINFQIVQVSMARKRNRSSEPAEIKYKCMEENCNHMSSIRFLPNHHLAQHGNQSGRFECSLCGYRCSNKAVCILKHICRAHRKGEAKARFNPYLNPGEHRVKTEHTDECRDEKLNVKPKRIRKSSVKKTVVKRNKQGL